MFCIAAFVVLSIMGIFSASNRQLAKEAFDCVGRRVTLRPCNTGFDEKMKAKILGVVITRSESAARFLNKYFEALAWVFMVLTIGSAIMFGRGLYLFYVTGSCNGLNDEAFCVFDPSGANNQVSPAGPLASCKVTPTTVNDLTLKDVDLKSFPVLNPTSPDKIVMIGCYSCDYTRKAYPEIKQMVDKFHLNFTFLHYPVKDTSDYLHTVGYCAYQEDKDKYWKLNDALFTGDKTQFADKTYVHKILSDTGYDPDKIETCVTNPFTQDAAKKQMDEVVKTKFYGTPTLFIGDQVFVGPKPYRVYAIAVKGLFYWLQ